MDKLKHYINVGAAEFSQYLEIGEGVMKPSPRQKTSDR
jgi:hypothetical protein